MIDQADPTFDCAIDYDIDVPCVTMIWKGYATSAQFRAANECVLTAIQERRASKLLGDAKDFVLIGADDQMWLAGNWIPRALQAGVRRIALVSNGVVISEDGFVQFWRRLCLDRLSGTRSGPATPLVKQQPIA